jgi:3-hydroxybutyryl-CoA dehydrogenase
MKIVVITNDTLKEELLVQGVQDTIQLEWQDELHPVHGADGYIDLLFNNSPDRIAALTKLQPAIVIVNAVIHTLSEFPPDFTRINGWNSFLKRPLVEAVGTDAGKAMVEKIFSGFNKTVEWVADVPGFITARVISMIINEAYFTLDEKVSTKEEIDTAMKLGTNYPYGPFEWGEMIGLKKVVELLTTLAHTDPRYQPSALLQKEALSL